jgi:hypothetical protein
VTATPPLEPGARRSLRALLRGGQAARGLACADLALFRWVRRAARPPWMEVVGRFSRLGEHAAVWLALGAAGAALDSRRRARWRRGLIAVAAGRRSRSFRPSSPRRRP